MMTDAQPTGHGGVRPPARRSREASVQSSAALDLARNIGAAGFRATLYWQIARTLFRIFFAGSLAAFAGRLIEDGTFGMAELIFALAGLVLSGAAGLFADLRAAGSEAELVDRLRAAIQDTLSG